MPQKKPQLTPLEARKQMLLLESELNRDRMIESILEWREEFHHSKEQITKISSMASLVARGFTTFLSVKRLFSGGKGGKKSWVSFILDGLSTGASIWSLFQSHQNKHEEKAEKD